MRQLLASLLIAAGLGGHAAAQPFQDFFNYQEPRMPVGDDCTGATWYGEFAGKRFDDFRDMYYPVSARGCFHSEFDCRIWNQQAITYLGRGPMLYATCRPIG